MTKHLKNLEQFLKSKFNDLSEKDWELVLFGDKEYHGLFKLSSTKQKLTGSLKKSATTALNLLRDLLESQSNFFFEKKIM